MSTTLPWFRVYSEILTDRKIKRVCKITRQSKALVIGVWISLLALANESPSRGELILAPDVPLTLEDLEEELEVEKEIIQKIIEEFTKLGMIQAEGTTLQITNWEKRQFKSDTSTERVRDYRTKRYGNNDETLQKRSSNVLDTEQIQNRTDTDTDTEQTTPDPELARVVVVYQNNIGMLTAYLRDELIAAVEEYPPGWIEEAIKIAVENNARNWKYCKAILSRWKTHGKDSDTRKTKVEDKRRYDEGEFAEYIQ